MTRMLEGFAGDERKEVNAAEPRHCHPVSEAALDDFESLLAAAERRRKSSLERQRETEAATQAANPNGRNNV